MAEFSTELPAYLRKIDDNDLLRHAYFGTDGFADGGFLFRHRREDDEQYGFRRMLAYYLNYTAPVVNSHVDPVFKDPATRDYTGAGSSLWETYAENVNGAGTEIGDFMKMAGLSAKLFGGCVIITDNKAEQPATVAEVLQTRALPYSYIVTPDRITDFEIDALGVLVSISYTEAEIGEDGKRTNETLIRKWTRQAWALYRDSKLIRGEDHNLGRVPATILLSRKLDPGAVKPPSEFLSVARTNLHIYQLCSWLAEIHANQTFAILTYPVVGKAPESLTLGTNNALAFNGEGRHAPEWKAPPADPAKSLQDQIDRLIQEIYRMASLSYVTGTKQASSGVAKAWDFEKTNQALTDLAQNCEAAEKDLADLFALWTGQALAYTCSYPREFALADIAQELADAQAVLDMTLGQEVKVEVAKKVMELYFDLEPERFDEILASIQAEAEDAYRSAQADKKDPADDEDPATEV
jgi:hypothetical protein